MRKVLVLLVVLALMIPLVAATPMLAEPNDVEQELDIVFIDPDEGLELDPDAVGNPYMPEPDADLTEVVGAADEFRLISPAFANIAGFYIWAEVLEYGQAVTAVIIDAGELVTQALAESMIIDVHALTERPNTNPSAIIYNGPREITNVYVSNARTRGQRAASGNYIVVELKYGFNNTFAQVNGSAAHAYSTTTAAAIAWPLDLNYTVTIDGSNVDYIRTMQPIVDDFELVPNPVDGFTTQSYRLFTPPGSAGRRMPLVLFNHGFGETFQSSAATGRNTEGQQLVAQEAATSWITEAPDAAYVLLPQRGTAAGNPGYSRAGVAAFINNMIEEGKVDPNRVYISGLSMGGAESLLFMREFPDLFVAALIICPFGTANYTLEQLEPHKHIPTWFVHTADDPVATLPNSTNLYDRLHELGAQDVRLTNYPAVTIAGRTWSVFGNELPNAYFQNSDGDFSEFYPNSHWSWVMPFNNLYVADGGIAGSTGQGTTFMGWLFSHGRPAAPPAIANDVYKQEAE